MSIFSKIFWVCLFLTSNITAQNSLQSPNEFLPHRLGAHFTPHHLLVDYYQQVAENSPKVVIQQYGETTQNRPLFIAIVSHPDNIENIEAIRKNNLSATGLLDEKVSNKNAKAIVWLSYGVHGNEAGASESSIAAIYELARTDKKDVNEWLKNTVVIIDPCINPDGYSRYTHWNRDVGNKIPNPSTECREHHEPWPGGRVNHYLFDLNRDWAWQTQIESQQRLKIYHEWMPHIHADFHEMYHNDTYYFAPAAQPYHKYITDWQGEFQMDIGKNHASYFDANDWLYFTREIFDLFYPSYGDTYPIFNGAIGMTYEQGGHSMAGRAILTENGDTLTLDDRILHHVTTSLSTVEVSSKNADRLWDNFKEYFKDANNNPPGDYKAYLIKSGNQKGKIEKLCKLLDNNKIEYRAAKSGTSVSGFHYQSGESKATKVENGDLIIPAAQPMAVLTQVLFEPEPFLIDSLTYDITAWALPYAFGLDAYALKENIGSGDTYELPEFEAFNGKVKPYAYFLTSGINETKVLMEMVNEGFVAKKATKQFELEGKKYNPGTVIFTSADNRKKANFHQTIQQIANDNEVTLATAKSGFVTSGNDLGSGSMELVKKPKILVLGGTTVNANSFGQVWHYLENDLGISPGIISPKEVANIPIADYTHLIMTDGGYSDIDSSGMEKIKAWVSDGGRLIGIGSALKKLSKTKGFDIKKKKNSSKAPSKTKNTYAGSERRYIARSMPGAIYKSQLDTSHPLASGMPDYYFTLKTSSSTYELMSKGGNVCYIDNDPLKYGFVGHLIQATMKNSLVFGVQKIGNGNVVYMVDNPLFRGFWENGKMMMSNAIFMP